MITSSRGLKIAYLGGVKSGKSRLAEAKALELSGIERPYYLATSEFTDDEMNERIEVHKIRRGTRFQTVEEPLKLYETVKQCETPVLIDCLTVWMSNMLHHKNPEQDILSEILSLFRLDQTIIMVQNEVGFGVIPENPLARRFVDISGRVSQILGEQCDELYFCSAGLQMAMKK